MPWLILKTEPSKEQRVVINLQSIFETYCPMEARAYRHGLHRQRAIKEIPLLPRLVFIHRKFVDGLQDIVGHLYVLGLGRDAQGGLFVIPDYQMADFREAVSGILKMAYRAYELKQPVVIVKPEIVHSFEDMAKVLNARYEISEKLLEAAE